MSEQIKSGSNDLHTGETIRTFRGHYVNVFDPDPETIDIVDIAHALSHVCRFAGHTPIFYSVAQHSIQVSNLCHHEHKLAGLLHDASEAYLCDIPRPIKRHLQGYKAIEENLMRVIAGKFGLLWPLHSEVKDYDQVVLEREHRTLILNRDYVHAMSHSEAKERFLQKFYLLNQAQL